MSTRASIVFSKTATHFYEGNPNNGYRESHWYHHYDGYPTGVGFELVGIIVKLIKKSDEESFLDIHGIDSLLKTTLSHEWEHDHKQQFPGDIEYLYRISFDDGISIKCYARGSFENSVDDSADWKCTEIFRADECKIGKKTYYNIAHVTIKNG